jgi:hypothetical protein
MYLGFPEDGDKCREKDCRGRLAFPKVENCSCHINPPCGACTMVRLTCDECGWKDEGPDNEFITVAPGLMILEHRTHKTDPNKINYRIKMHSGCSQICEGTYPEWATSKDVLALVKGTFGGRFESFGGGKFTYIAYTD